MLHDQSTISRQGLRKLSIGEWYIYKIRKVDRIKCFITSKTGKYGQGDLENKIILHKKQRERIICSPKSIFHADLFL